MSLIEIESRTQELEREARVVEISFRNEAVVRENDYRRQNAERLDLHKRTCQLLHDEMCTLQDKKRELEAPARYARELAKAVENLRAKRARDAEGENPDAVVERLRAEVVAIVTNGDTGGFMKIQVPESVQDRIDEILPRDVFTKRLSDMAGPGTVLWFFEIK